MASHVSQCMASHVCDKWQAMCVTHGMPCVNMHAHHEGYKYGHGQLISWSRSFNPYEQEGGGGREKEEEERKGRKGKEEGMKGEEKGKKKREEEMGGKEEKKERGRGRSVAQ